MECCDNAGGRVLFKAGGKQFNIRAAITIRPSRIEVDGEANQDGSVYYLTKPVPAEADITLSDRCGELTTELIDGCLLDVTIKLIDMNRTYLFTRARVTGRPALNTETGEISGMTVKTAQCKQVNR